MTLQMLVVAAIISFLAGCFSGYKLEEANTVKAELALSGLREAGDLALKHYKREVELLKGETASIQQNSAKALSDSAKDFEEFKVQQAKNLSRKEQEIANLKFLASGQQDNLAKLKVELAEAKTEAERVGVEVRIALEQKLLAENKARQAGLECLTVPVPAEYLTNLNQVGK